MLGKEKAWEVVKRGEGRGAGILVLITAFALTVFEGAVRKWIIGSASSPASYVVYLSKDLAFALLVFLPYRPINTVALDAFRGWLVPGLLLLICGALMSATQEINLAGSVLSIRSLIFLPLLACLAGARLQGLSLMSVAKFIGVVTTANFALGVLQNQLPSDHILTTYVGDTVEATAVASGVRATGTFSYISGMAVMAAVGVWGGIIALSLGKTVWQKAFGWMVLVSGLGCGLAAVSRGPILLAILVLGIWLVLSHGRAIKNLAGALGIILLGVSVYVLNLADTFMGLGYGLILRAQEAGGINADRPFQQLPELAMAIGMAPFGAGLGTEQVGGNYFSTGEMKFRTYEAQLPRLVLETGVFGLVGFLITCMGALISLQRAKEKATSHELKNSILATQLFLFFLFAMDIAFNHVASSFAWMIFAAVLASSASVEPRTSRAPYAPLITNQNNCTI